MNLDPYQDSGAHWLATNASPVLYLADQMRVGKTPQCAAAAGRLRARAVLVVCPAIVRGGWLSEFQNFCEDRGIPENAVVIYGHEDLAKIDYNKTRLIIVSYDMAIRKHTRIALSAFGAINGFDVVIFDEAHYLGNDVAKRTMSLLGKPGQGGGIVEYTKRQWWVSGTPYRRDPSGLYPFCNQAGVWPGLRKTFEREFCTGFHDGYQFKIAGGKNLEKLKGLIAPYQLRRLRSDISEGAEVRLGTLIIEGRDIDPDQPTIRFLAYNERHRADALREAIANGTLDQLPIASVATIRRLIGLAKVAGVAEIINNALEMEPSKKIVVFGIHRDPLRFLRASLKPTAHPVLIYGGMPPKKREALVNHFRFSEKPRVAICNTTTAGLGIDLSVADDIYVFEPSWTPIDNAQAICRIIDVRKPRDKQAFFVGLAGSIDDQITRICEKRAREFEQLYSAV